MQCPVVSAHHLVEIATGLFQCPDCGAGPGLYWALSEVSHGERAVDAQCITYRPDLMSYVISYLYWEVEDGKRVADSLSSELLGYLIEPDEMRTAPLPFMAETPRKLVLKPLMFPSPLGEKQYGQRGAQSGTSARGLAPAGSAGHSRRRRPKAGS
jgi:hypothetical protein